MAALRERARQAVPGLSAAQIAAMHLQPRSLDKMLGGSNPKFHAQADGHRFTFKVKMPGSLNFVRDQFANTLRSAAGEATIPLVAQTLPLPDGQVVPGYAKPSLEGAKGSLPAEVTRWNAAQRALVLADAPWAEFLGNYDLKTDQYDVVPAATKGVGEDVAVNLDWDASLIDYKTARPLDRFKSMGWMAPAQSLLYQAYVRGDVELDFAPVFEAIDRIQALPESKIRAAMAPFIASAFADGQSFGPFTSPEPLVQAVLARQQNLKVAFTTLVTALDAERAHHQHPHLPGGDDFQAAAQDAWLQVRAHLIDAPFMGQLYRHQQEQSARKMGLQLPGPTSVITRAQQVADEVKHVAQSVVNWL